MIRRVIWIFVLLAGTGCASSRTFEITATPPDAVLKVDGIERGRGQIDVPISFNGDVDSHTVTAERPGYSPASVSVGRDYPDTRIDIQLKPLQRRIHLSVVPVPGYIKVDGKLLAPDMVSEASAELQFTLDNANQWTTYIVTADRAGFATATTRVSYEADPEYSLTLEPGKRDVTITTTPEGARVLVDDDEVGVSPVKTAMGFAYDPSGDHWQPRTITAIKPGWEPTTMPATVEDTQGEYHLDLDAKSKTVFIATEPPGGAVTIDGQTLARSADGSATAELSFPPVDERGTLKTYTAIASLKTGDSQWEPKPMTIGWDGGRVKYSVKLKEVTTRPVSTVAVDVHHDVGGGWELAPRYYTTVASNVITEAGGPQPVLLYRAPDSQTIDTMTISPDGSQMLLALLVADKNNFRSLILARKSDGTGATEQMNDGNSLDVMPSYNPDGDAIVYASNRAGRNLAIWKRAVSGVGGITALTDNRDEQDLWPAIDADPRTHLFYEALYDGQAQSRLYMTTLGTTIRSEFMVTGITQPRLSPKGDSVAFVSTNPKTGRREIYLLSIASGLPELLVGSPDSDNYDPTFSHDGTRLAFTSDRGVDEDGRHNADIWVMSLANPSAPQQITSNGSVDDCPAWDPVGNSIYFRSNRGGAWGIWRIDLK